MRVPQDRVFTANLKSRGERGGWGWIFAYCPMRSRSERTIPNARRHTGHIFFGRLHESKGLDEIVKACTQLKNDGFDFQFNCFGDGPMKDAFLDQMSETLGSRFHYGGVLTSNEKYTELDKADIFLLPSIYGEGLPMAILEAMAAGCIIVASEMASVAAVIEDGVNGYLTNSKIPPLVSRLNGAETERVGPVREAAIDSTPNILDRGYIEKLEDIYRSAPLATTSKQNANAIGSPGCR